MRKALGFAAREPEAIFQRQLPSLAHQVINIIPNQLMRIQNVCPVPGVKAAGARIVGINVHTNP